MRRPKKKDALASKPMRIGLPFSGLSFQTGGEDLVIVCDRDDLSLTDNVIGYRYSKAVGATLDVAKCNPENVSWAHWFEEFGASEPLAWSFKGVDNVIENANAGQDGVVRKVTIKCRVIYRDINANHFIGLLLKSLSSVD